MDYKYYKEVTGELVRVHIEQDTTPENPRYDWDGNIGHMMCWHRDDLLKQQNVTGKKLLIMTWKAKSLYTTSI